MTMTAVEVVRADNPGPLTLEGTNTYLVWAPGATRAIVVDPGPDDPAHRRAVEARLGVHGIEAGAVVLTHHHPDHAEAAGWAREWGVPLLANDPSLIEVPAEPLADGEVVDVDGASLEAIHTPGHASDHLCLMVTSSRVLLTGDHILGRGTTVVAWPDGDMIDYMASLDRVDALGAVALAPGHGARISDPDSVIAGYIAHRRAREAQVLDAVQAGARSAAEVVLRVYADVDPVLHPAAERSVRAHLDKLVADGAVIREGGTVEADEVPSPKGVLYRAR